jgi:two-component system response regulator QseB
MRLLSISDETQPLLATLPLSHGDLARPVLLLFREAIDEACLTLIRRYAGRDASLLVLLYSDGTARDEVAALEAGADECLRVAFSIERFEAQLQTRARRGAVNVPTAHRLAVDPHTFRASVDGRPIHLSPREFRLLFELWRQRGRIVPHEHLEHVMYGDVGADCRQGVRQIVHRLRLRLRDLGSLVQGVSGVGYLLQSSVPNAADVSDRIDFLNR